MDYLDRVLEALRLQTLSLDRWELVFVDNASSHDVAINLDWQPQARIVREEELGVTQARLTGIREARGELVVFVDDDNILNTNYLDSAIRIASNWPQLGSWSGRVVPEFGRCVNRSKRPMGSLKTGSTISAARDPFPSFNPLRSSPVHAAQSRA